MKMTQHTIRHGTAVISYELIRSRRKTLGITVYPDGRVVVRAPLGTSAHEVEGIVGKRADWITGKQQMFADLPPPAPPRRYISGETHLFLGRPYSLHVLEDRNQGVTLDGSRMALRVRDAGDTERKRRVLTEWYRARAKLIFAERLDACYPRAAAREIPFPQMKIRLMKRRWGSCSSKGSILLNLRLIQTPIRCIDYVILHELAHLKVPHHNKAYYALLDQLLPGWRELREELNQIQVA